MPRAFFVALVSALAASTVRAQPARTPPCGQLAAQIKSRAAASAEGDPWKQVSTGSDRVIVPARSTRITVDRDDDGDQLLEAFQKRFKPDRVLDSALEQFLDGSGRPDLWQLPDSRRYALEIDGGTAVCQSFVFFETRPNGTSTLVPKPPGDAELCIGFGKIGNLARVAGSDAFVEYTFTAPGDSFGLTVIPARAGGWGEPCTVSVSYASSFPAKHVFTSPQGAVAEKSFGALASQIVERWVAADESDRFRFGPPVPAADRPAADVMLKLAGRLGNTAVPTFGHEAALEPTEDSTNSAKAYPIVIDGKTYVVQIGRSNVGWRTFRSTIVIVYRLNGGELEPIASAVIDQQRGALKSVTTGP